MPAISEVSAMTTPSWCRSLVRQGGPNGMALAIYCVRTEITGRRENVKYTKKHKKDENPGDVIGLSDERADVKIPHPPSDGSTPRGIEVGEEKRSDGTGNLRPAKVTGGGAESDYTKPKISDDL